MKKLITIVLVVMVPLAFAPAAMAKDLKVIELKYSDHAPPMAGGNIFMKNEYLPKVQAELAKLGYKLDITFYHASSLYKCTSTEIKFRRVKTG